MTKDDTTPRVWIGCLACYNAGRLVGEWVDGLEAGALTPSDVHAERFWVDTAEQGTPHEELWVMDHEGYGGLLSGECSPAEAQELAELLDELGDDAPAYAAYADNVGRDYATVEGFREAYQGEWENTEDFALELAEGMGWLATMDEAGVSSCYFDARSFASDLFLSGDYYSAPSTGGCVFVFQAL